MRNLIRHILKESSQEKFINLMVDKIRSGQIKSPYFKNLNKLGIDNSEIEIILSNFFGGNVNLYHLSAYDKEQNLVYREDYYGNWEKYEYDEMGNLIYQDNSRGKWVKWGYDEMDNLIYYENSYGYWEKLKYDEMNNLIYHEDSKRGVIIDKR